jgi:hypothetical protein
MGFVGRKPTNAPLTSDDIPNGIIGAADLASGLSKLTWVTTVKTSGFTAVANEGYFCNTTSSGFTVTLPATPSAGDQIQLVDYAGTFDTNALTISPNGNKIEGSTDNVLLSGEREGVRLVYIDSTQGWLATSGINEGTDALEPTTYSVDFLVIAGGGGGGSWVASGGGAGGYRNSYLTESSGANSSSEASLTFNAGTVYTVTVGAGGTGGQFNVTDNATNGSNSSISGSNISTITSTGGGRGKGYDAATPDGISGGSGGGGRPQSGTGGSGTANQGSTGGDGAATSGGAGGGGAGAVGGNATTSVGGNGGNGLASSITGSSVTRAGGGAGSCVGGTPGTGGTGGGGNGSTSGNGGAGTANTGSGGGGTHFNDANAFGGNGGSGVVILRIPTAKYSGTTTGSPTVTTDGSDKVIVFNSSGSITG